jgi:hypothetical protein
MNGELPVTHEWLAELSSNRYRPMRRLLCRTDLDFLRRQHGFDPAMEKRLRAQRVLIFNEYLRQLDADFRRLCSELTSDAALRLRWRVSLAWNMMWVKAGVKLYGWGFGGVDVEPLLETFDRLLAEFHTVALHAEHAPA